MNIQFLKPLSNGFNRMKAALFKPFDLKKWFVVGFTAFLAGLGDGSSGGDGNAGGNGNDMDFGVVLDAPYSAWSWLQDHPTYYSLAIMGIIFVVGLIVVLLWLSSRGKFMFLYNVVTDRAEIAKPWRQYTRLGNSLFLWRLAFVIVVLTLFVTFFINVWQHTHQLYFNQSETVPFTYLVQMGFLFLLLLLAVAYIDMLLSAFVVPIMYKHNKTATNAWGTFLSIHWSHFSSFLLFGVLRLVLFLGIGAMLLVFGLFTCCLGFILLALPYINSVVTLPISFTLRAFSLDFLAQFGDEFNVFLKGLETDYPEAVG